MPTLKEHSSSHNVESNGSAGEVSLAAALSRINSKKSKCFLHFSFPDSEPPTSRTYPAPFGLIKDGRSFIHNRSLNLSPNRVNLWKIVSWGGGRCLMRDVLKIYEAFAFLFSKTKNRWMNLVSDLVQKRPLQNKSHLVNTLYLNKCVSQRQSNMLERFIA